MNKQNDVGGVEWRHTAQRVLAAWDSTVLPASRDGMMQERMEELRALLASPAAVGWIPVSERLPDAYTPVALINVNEWMNTGKDDFDANRSGTGWLCDWTTPGYWSVIGERGGCCLDAYTHWMPLPSPPAIASQEVGHDSAE